MKLVLLKITEKFLGNPSESNSIGEIRRQYYFLDSVFCFIKVRSVRYLLVSGRDKTRIRNYLENDSQELSNSICTTVLKRPKEFKNTQEFDLGMLNQENVNNSNWHHILCSFST